jgi:hypothetical protein
MNEEPNVPARLLSRNDYRALKDATQEAVEKAGGCAKAGGETRVGPSYLSRYGNVHEAMFAPVDVAAELDALAGEPVIARALAALSGYQLVKMTAANDAQTFHRHLATVSERAAGAVADLARALEDARVSPEESRALHKPVGLAIAALCELQHDLKAVG